jgi:hypothetical protein
VKAKVTNGKLRIALWVSPDKDPFTVGFVDITGIGAGGMRIAGSELTLEVTITGDYDLTGTPAAVKANGTYRMKGTAMGTGQFPASVPVNLSFPVHNLRLTVTSVRPRRVTGLLGKAPWSATRRGGVAAKSAEACGNAG